MPSRKQKFQKFKHRHSRSLGDVLEDPSTYGVRVQPRAMKRRKQVKLEKKFTEQQAAELSAKVMALVKEHQKEEKERNLGDSNSLGNVKISLSEKAYSDSDEDEHLDVDDFDGFTETGSTIAGSEWGAGQSVVELDEREVELMNNFINQQPQSQVRTLADFIKPFINEEEEQKKGRRELLLSKCQQVGEILARYTSGKIPRMFKILPATEEWEELLFHMDPEQWSPHAVYQATKVFISNLKGDSAQRFVNLILLPRFRQEIRDNKKVHFSTFRALKKATFKPAAFYRGLLLPLCRGGDCTVREAVTLESVIKRQSISSEHSAVALLKLAEMPYSGTTSYFIKALIDKKYALPYTVIDALVEHFMRFQLEVRMLPVVWHQSFLLFVQRYKNSIKGTDQKRLRQLLKSQRHEKIGPVIEQELNSARSREDKNTMDVDANQIYGQTENNNNDIKPVVFMDTT
eukprot:TRINITY_DN5498_c0_g1_i6.p1 TRINITY_DN5498_c0_g1~~TRINITY_DN5498_c0_g1_i6.p1  ORF type:complete len:459 (-),score=61.02 TRINITY_DN5498_c0_g1_i6:761-2137(-)